MLAKVLRLLIESRFADRHFADQLLVDFIFGHLICQRGFPYRVDQLSVGQMAFDQMTAHRYVAVSQAQNYNLQPLANAINHFHL